MGQSFSTSKGPTLQSDASQPNTETSLDRSTSSQANFPTINNNQNISKNYNILHHSNLIQRNQGINLDDPFRPKEELQIVFVHACNRVNFYRFLSGVDLVERSYDTTSLRYFQLASLCLEKNDKLRWSAIKWMHQWEQNGLILEVEAVVHAKIQTSCQAIMSTVLGIEDKSLIRF